MIKRYLVILTLALLSTSCASLVSQSEYPVTIVSCPPEAEFIIQNQDGEYVTRGITPMSVTLDSGDGYFSPAEYKVSFKKKGYNDNYATIEASIDGWYFGSILPIPLMIFIVDPITGAMWKLPGYASTSLKPKHTENNENITSKNITSYAYLCDK